MTQTQLARAVPLSQSQVSGIEVGAKGTTDAQIRRIDAVLNANGALVRRWESLNRADGFAAWFRGVVPIEKESTEIRQYQPLTVPGLLQTKQYAQAVIQQGQPALVASEVDKRVSARADRQVILSNDDGPLVRVVLEEHVLRRPLGGSGIMRDQLGHLLRATESSRISVQVVATNTEIHPGMDGAFQLFTVPNKGTIVYTETRMSGTAVDTPEAIEDYLAVFAELRGVALPPKASRDLMMQITEEFENA